MDKPKQLMLSGELVKQSNEIARSQLQLKMEAKNKIICGRIIASIAASIHIDDEDFKPYTFPAASILPTENLGGSDYNIIDAATDDLMTAYFVQRYTDEKGKKGFKKYSLFGSIEYKDGLITATFSLDIKPHFLKLQSNFSQYGLIEYLMLTSRYSQKLFEVLSSWKNAKEVVISLEDLYFSLNVPPTVQKRFGDVRRYILNLAQKEITTYTNMDFDWEPIKQGRSIVAIRFIFGKALIAARKKEQNTDKIQKQTSQNNKLALAVRACRKEKNLKQGVACLNPICTKKKREVCAKIFTN